MRNSLRKPACWVFLILSGKQRILLAHARLEYREQADAHVFTGRPRHGHHHGAGRANRRQGQVPGPVLFRQAARFSFARDRAVPRLEADSSDSVASARRSRLVAYWAADYWVTLFTSGLLTAATGALLVYWSRCLGCRPGRAALLGLAYGLATPAYVYATLAYGHQATAFALFTSFFLLWKKARAAGRLSCFSPGFWPLMPP